MKQYHKNPRQITEKQMQQLTGNLSELGDLSGIVHDLNSDEVIGGNQRSKAFNIDLCEIELTHEADTPDEQGTVAHGFVVWKGKRYAYRQVRWTPEQCEKANVVANKAGGSWDFDILANEFDVADLLDWGFEAFELGIEEEEFSEELPDVKPNPRQLPIDVIYTLQGADATCCLAVRAGWLYGIQSPRSTICPYCERGDANHAVQFIDNDYFDYDHRAHVSMVSEHHPRYCTTRDVMSQQQCEDAGIEYYELAQILDWAEELQEHAENVIIIPKYDCIEQIPDKFMLGYSIPTSHGGTPLPVELFKGRRVHLLGGSWKKQLRYLAALGDDVVSLDNNYVQRQASLLGSTVDVDGNESQMQDIGFSKLNNVRYVALALSFGAIGHAVNELYAGHREPGNIENGDEEWEQR